MPPSYSYGPAGSSPSRGGRHQWPAYLLLLLPLLVVYFLAGTQNLPTGKHHLMAYLLACLCLGVTMINLNAGILLIVLAIGISPEFGFDQVSNLRFEDFMIPSVFAIWLMKQMSSGEPFVETHLKTPILVYLLLGAISTLHNVGFSSLNGKTAFFIYFKYIEYLLLLTMVCNLVKTERQISAVLMTSMLSSLIAAFIGMHQRAAGLDWGSRVTGPDGETANIYGGYLLFHMMLGFGLLVACKRPHLRLGLILYMLILFYVTLRTLSRGSYIGLSAAMILMGFLVDRRILMWVVLFLVAAPLFFPHDVADRLGTIVHVLPGTGQDAPTSWQAKTQSWGQLRSDIFDNPLLGMGAGAYPMGWVDNEYLKVMIEVGFIGLLVWFWWIGKMLWLGWRNFREARIWWHQGLSVGYLCGLAGLMVHAVAATSLTAIRTMESVMVLTALTISLTNLLRRKASLRQRGAPAEAPDELPPAPSGLYLPPVRLTKLRRAGAPPPG